MQQEQRLGLFLHLKGWDSKTEKEKDRYVSATLDELASKLSVQADPRSTIFFIELLRTWESRTGKLEATFVDGVDYTWAGRLDVV